jgi:predicted DNA-binding antitoxin AbrB/MazE fold protein
MSKVIAAVYTNGIFRPLEPVVLPEGEPVQVHVPESPPPHKSAWQHWKPLTRCGRN